MKRGFAPMKRGWAIHRAPGGVLVAAIAFTPLAAAPSPQSASSAGAMPQTAMPQQPTASPSDARERNRIAAEAALERALVPRPMDRDRFVALLRAADPALASNTALLDAHAAYLAAIERQTKSATRQIRRLLPASYGFDPARETFAPRATPELVALLSLRDRALRTVAAEERTLLEAVAGAVAPERSSAHARAVLAWRLEQLPTANRLASTRITILELLDEIRVGDESRAAIAPFTDEYARTVAKAFEARSVASVEADAARAIAETNAGALWYYAPPGIREEIEDSLAAIADREYATELAIRDLQFDALARIRARLQPREGRRLVELWQRTLHPELFDDERLLSRIVEETMSHPSFSDDQDNALIDALDVAYQRLEPLSRAACEAADAVVPASSRASRAAMEAEIDARLALIDAQSQRRAIIRDAMQRARIMFADVDPAIGARIEDAIYTVDSLGRADQFEQRTLLARRDALADDAGSVRESAQNQSTEGGAYDAPPAAAPNGVRDTAAPGAAESGGGSRENGVEPPTTRTPRGSRGGRRGLGTP